MAEQDATLVLQTLARQAADRNRRLLVLIDEAEALVHVAETHPVWVQRLLAVLVDPQIRTIIASTKWLAQLENMSHDGVGSVLLQKFQVAFLSRLEEAAARSLVRQEQGERLVMAADGTVDDVFIHTNGQPYLVQFLCQRLFEVDDDGRGRLRPVRDEDLEPNELLAALFANDFRQLTRTEQRVLLSVARQGVAKQREIVADLQDISPGTVSLYLYGLDRLGFLRRIFSQWAIGNEYLQRWLSAELSAPTQMLAAAVDDSAQKMVTESARQTEITYCREQLQEAETELRRFDVDGLPVIGEDTRWVLERGALLRRRIAKLKRDLGEITDNSH